MTEQEEIRQLREELETVLTWFDTLLEYAKKQENRYRSARGMIHVLSRERNGYKVLANRLRRTYLNTDRQWKYYVKELARVVSKTAEAWIK